MQSQLTCRIQFYEEQHCEQFFQACLGFQEIFQCKSRFTLIFAKATNTNTPGLSETMELQFPVKKIGLKLYGRTVLQFPPSPLDLADLGHSCFLMKNHNVRPWKIHFYNHKSMEITQISMDKPEL